MKSRTNVRAAVFFAMLGLIGAGLLARLAYLQIGRSEANRSAADRQRDSERSLPASRGTIVDRNGALLAFDRRVFEVRAEVSVKLGEGRELQQQQFAEFADALATDLGSALSLDRDLDRDRRALRQRIERCAPDGSGRAGSHKLDFLVSPAIESAAVLWRLRQLDEGRDKLFLHFQLDRRRTYPFRKATIGPVGFVGERVVAPGKSEPVYRGMESFAGLLPGAPGRRGAWRDACSDPFWTADLEAPARPAVLETTLDLELQRAAHDELQSAVASVVEQFGSPPAWGAMCLVEFETGELLAMASYRDGVDPKIAAFAPLQYLCPPGSVMKPLVFAIGLERGVIDWDGETIDCYPTDSRGWRVPGSSRFIKDAHDCGALTPREVIVQSSNVGAAQVGRRLGRDGILEFIERFQLGQPTGTALPGERSGSVYPGPAELRSMPERRFQNYAAPSLSYGYGCNLPPIQVLRAYLTLLSGRQRELRLYRRLAVGGRVEELPCPEPGPVFLSVTTRARLIDAMRGVVSLEPHATGRYLAEELARLGATGAVAGKTGTSEYDERKGGQRITMRTASFAGFAPIERPKFVAICVLQKPEADHFWGGRYAAPAAGRLLLRALSQLPSRRSAAPQVSVGTPGGVGLTAQQR